MAPHNPWPTLILLQLAIKRLPLGHLHGLYLLEDLITRAVQICLWAPPQLVTYNDIPPNPLRKLAAHIVLL
jgi:hypothetical protein